MTVNGHREGPRHQPAFMIPPVSITKANYKQLFTSAS